MSVCLAALVALALPALAVAAPSPEALQNAYDRARDTGDRAAIRRVERFDHRPGGLRIPATLPRVPDRRAHPEGAPDARLALELERLGRSFDGWAAFWVHDLRTGRTAGWNSDARFPAASMVKLAVLDAAVRRFGGPGGPADYDLRQLGAWSSNLAANRLYRLVGAAATDRSLARLGMRSSTYTGPYRAGTAFDAPKPPPHAHTRVTTAHDLGRALSFFQRRSPLALRYLLGSWPKFSLVRRGLPAGTTVAEKDGWISGMRGSAAIAYLPSGPKIVVVLAYQPKIDEHAVEALGTQVARLVAG
jgi:beta-lactamase class A